MKRVLFSLILCAVFALSAQSTHAITGANNKYGIHVATPSEQDIKDGAALVNTNGSWGYMTVVLQEKDRDKKSLQHMCDHFRDNKLIPIFRLASHAEGNSWALPKKRDAFAWADVLGSVNCSTKNIYVTLFNEVNMATEWGGAVNPKSYADIALFYANAIKNKNPDVQVLLAGLNQTAPHNPPYFNSAQRFLDEVLGNQSPLCNIIDGIASHSYPPDFIGSPNARGLGSIAGYQVEQAIYEKHCGRKLPVFITEAGWKNNALSPAILKDYYKNAFEEVWAKDDSVRAVTLYDLNGSPPNTDFAYRAATAEIHGIVEQNSTCGGFREIYCFIKNDLQKTNGDPAQKYSASILVTIPQTVIANSKYEYQIWIKNNPSKSTATWSKNDGYRIGFTNNAISGSFTDFHNVKPGNSFITTLTFNSGADLKTHNLKVCLFKGAECVNELFAWNLTVVAPPKLEIEARVFPLAKASGEGYELQIFRARDEKLVFRNSDIVLVNGKATIPAVSGIALDEAYRIVLLGEAKAYLPVQVASYLFTGKDDKIQFPAFVPIDFNGDGKFTLSDFLGR